MYLSSFIGSWTASCNEMIRSVKPNVLEDSLLHQEPLPQTLQKWTSNKPLYSRKHCIWKNQYSFTSYTTTPTTPTWEIHNSLQDAQRHDETHSPPFPFIQSLCVNHLFTVSHTTSCNETVKNQKGKFTWRFKGEASYCTAMSLTIELDSEQNRWVHCPMISRTIKVICKQSLNSDSTMQLNSCLWFNGEDKQPEARSRKYGTWNRDYDQFSTYQSPLIGSLSTPEMLSYAGHQS